MPRFTQEDLDEEILNLWNGITKSEQPDKNIKNNPVDIFDLIFDIQCYAIDFRLKILYNILVRKEVNNNV